MYSRPDEFRPERFLASANGGVIEQDPRELCFGFGRRSVSWIDSLSLRWSISDKGCALVCALQSSSIFWLLNAPLRRSLRRCFGFYIMCYLIGCLGHRETRSGWRDCWACPRIFNRNHQASHNFVVSATYPDNVLAVPSRSNVRSNPEIQAWFLWSKLS